MPNAPNQEAATPPPTAKKEQEAAEARAEAAAEAAAQAPATEAAAAARATNPQPDANRPAETAAEQQQQPPAAVAATAAAGPSGAQPPQRAQNVPNAPHQGEPQVPEDVQNAIKELAGIIFPQNDTDSQTTTDRLKKLRDFVSTPGKRVFFTMKNDRRFPIIFGRLFFVIDMIRDGRFEKNVTSPETLETEIKNKFQNVFGELTDELSKLGTAQERQTEITTGMVKTYNESWRYNDAERKVHFKETPHKKTALEKIKEILHAHECFEKEKWSTKTAKFSVNMGASKDPRKSYFAKFVQEIVSDGPVRSDLFRDQLYGKYKRFTEEEVYKGLYRNANANWVPINNFNMMVTEALG